MSRRGALAALLLACVGGAAAQVVAPPLRTGVSGEALVLNAELTLRVQSGRDLVLLVKPRPGDTWSALVARWASEATTPDALAAWNALSPQAPLPVEIRLPVSMLSDELRRVALGALFPADRLEGDAWVHRARAGTLPTYGEGLWQVAAWFTGDARHWSDLAQANALSGPELAPAQEVRVPAALLHPAFAARPTSADGTLEYGRDREGRYAGYRLKAGEALYSVVVLRYTGDGVA